MYAMVALTTQKQPIVNRFHCKQAGPTISTKTTNYPSLQGSPSLLPLGQKALSAPYLRAGIRFEKFNQFLNQPVPGSRYVPRRCTKNNPERGLFFVHQSEPTAWLAKGGERRSDISSAGETARRWLDRAERRRGESRGRLSHGAPELSTSPVVDRVFVWPHN